MHAVDIELAPDAEAELVRSWRIAELERAGYSPSDARQLADLTYVDLHQATRILRHGCPVDLALRILV